MIGCFDRPFLLAGACVRCVWMETGLKNDLMMMMLMMMMMMIMMIMITLSGCLHCVRHWEDQHVLVWERFCDRSVHISFTRFYIQLAVKLAVKFLKPAVYKKKIRLKPGFQHPSWRPELTARVDGWPVSITGQNGPCWRARVSTSRVDGNGNRSPVNSGR